MSLEAMIDRVGWTLVHSLWIGMIAWVLYVLAMGVIGVYEKVKSRSKVAPMSSSAWGACSRGHEMASEDTGPTQSACLRGGGSIAGGVAGASAFVSEYGQRSASLLQACALRPVTDCNCVAARRGGEQQEVKDWPVTRMLTNASR